MPRRDAGGGNTPFDQRWDCDADSPSKIRTSGYSDIAFANGSQTKRLVGTPTVTVEFQGEMGKPTSAGQRDLSIHSLRMGLAGRFNRCDREIRLPDIGVVGSVVIGGK